ncbi:hypothetical protein [Flavobacterium sp.]|uniref:hypothetical protein n=1 Tax=Flavobacterium sp. TaxID=239 RepID=UPI002609F0D9|nr:hypothetical protein [Flavobacterium sp.]
MRTKIILSTLLSLFIVNSFAQDRTTVNATSSEISDNLDLRAVASIFGDSRDLEDFERRLNDPKNQISNLDLNYDNQVDYLRVIESVEGRTHLIVLQSVLGKDNYQDVATVEVEKDSNNRIQVQVVGDVYMYGNNYIYEPIYVSTPIIYDYFWTPYYRPYCSSWYWGYYPSYYTYWSPFPVFRYRSNIGLFINFNHHYNYVNTRRCQVAYNNYYNRRGNYYERQYPNRSFERRNSGFTNRYELDRTRDVRTVGSTRNDASNNGIRNTSIRNNDVRPTRGNDEIRENTTRNNDVRPTRGNDEIKVNTTRNNDVRPSRGNDEIKVNSPTRNNDVRPSRGNDEIKVNSPTRNNDVRPTRNSSQRSENSNVNSSPRRTESTSQRSSSSRGNSSSRSSESSNRGGNSGRR